MADAPPDLPERLAGFRVLGELGRGGMGVVYDALDEALQRPVALKRMGEGLAGRPELRERFLREARAAARLSHPRIAAVFGIEELDDGGLLLVMERVEGQSLRATLSGGPRPLGEARGIARDVADALAEAHRAGIVHRDLKPENVVVDAQGRAKLLDFGIAKLLAGESSSGVAEGLTATGQVVGTAGYVAPELVEGGAADARADVFAFGVVLFELLGGRLPFDGATPVQRLVAVLRDDPPELVTLAPEAPPALCALVRRCLARDPSERPVDGAALARALETAWPPTEEGSVDPLALAATEDLTAAAVAARPSTLGAPRSPPPRSVPASPTPDRPASNASGVSAGGTAAIPGVADAARSPSPAQTPAAAWKVVAMTLAAGVVTVIVLVALRDREDARDVAGDRPGGAAGDRAPAEPPARSTSVASAVASDPSVTELRVFPCRDRAATSRNPTEQCSSGARAWCDQSWAIVACCAPGLVPHALDGRCGCPPGGLSQGDPPVPACTRVGGPAGLPRETLQASMRGVLRDLGGCYQRFVQSPGGTPADAVQPGIEGRIVLAFQIAPGGAVFSARVAESSFPQPEVQGCLVEMAEGLRLPPPVGSEGFAFSYPIELSP